MDSPDLSDAAAMTPDASDTGTSLSASEQARLRRERRKAKVGQGADRLKKITQTQKGPGFDTSYADDVPPIAKITSSIPNTNDNDDPPEIDISQHYFKPKTTPRPIHGGFDSSSNMNDSPGNMMFNDPSSFSMADLQQQQAQFQQLMMGNPLFNNQQQSQGRGQGQSQAQGPFGGMGMGMNMPMGDGTPGQDPMMDMLQQMLGQFSGEGGGGPGGADNPLAGMLSAMGGMGGMGAMPGVGGQATQIQSPQDVYGKWWKLLHAVCAMGLAMYAVWTMGGGFDGSKRMRALSGVEDKIPLFWYFTTMELLLQSTRFILEKGRPPANSMLSLIGSYLPPPFGSILLTLARYSVIWTTIWRDFLMLLFVLGICSWWNS